MKKWIVLALLVIAGCDLTVANSSQLSIVYQALNQDSIGIGCQDDFHLI